MPAYTTLDRAAERLNITADQLRAFEELGRILVINRNGAPFIRADQEYRAKFILRLQQVLKLNSREISEVLLREEPPYSLDDVDRILPDGGGRKGHAR
jgi:DNA-binding transcriptional MerR regulator